jgi:NADP-dependent 3-hydroxy acid dehydrogenase YdfG
MRSLGTPGHLVNISSVAADEPASGVYGATKHAVNVISRSLRLELLDDPIQVTTILPGVIASNIVRTMDAAWLAGIAAMTGLDVELPPGERIPDDVLERAQAALREYVARPEDVADAVHYAVTVDPAVHIQEITVRPHKDLSL